MASIHLQEELHLLADFSALVALTKIHFLQLVDLAVKESAS